MHFFNSFTPYASSGFYTNSWMLWVMGIGRVLVFVGFIWLIVWAVKHFTGTNHDRVYLDDEALAIIRERYAKGEITKEQYDVLKNDLEFSARRKR